MNESQPPKYDAKHYATFRPNYPKALFELIYSTCKSFDLAWDCACGTGQASNELAKQFRQVIATDISESQIQQAIQKDNIEYQVSSAEHTNIKEHSLDLITVAQALHWFDHEAFAKEVARALKPGGILAAWGYGYLKINPEIDSLVRALAKGPLDKYWAEGRDYLENEYHDIPFPFKRERHEEFFCEKLYKFEDLMGMLASWSPRLKYLNDHGTDILDTVKEPLLKAWGDPTEVKSTKFPIFLLIGQK